jgi:hypothetical protein
MEIKKIRATVLNICVPENGFVKATLDVEGYGELEIHVLDLVRVGDSVFVSEDSVKKALNERS